MILDSEEVKHFPALHSLNGSLDIIAFANEGFFGTDPEDFDDIRLDTIYTRSINTFYNAINKQRHEIRHNTRKLFRYGSGDY